MIAEPSQSDPTAVGRANGSGALVPDLFDALRPRHYRFVIVQAVGGWSLMNARRAQ